MNKKFAEVYWTWEDVRDKREQEGLPEWTQKQCEELLKKIDSDLCDAMCAAGWDVMGEAMTEGENHA